ncbi:MAG: hypothetical protein KAZ28_02875 [Bacteroidaceae bacterium]|jgi:exodeoxyribonuclease V alpha subunit|nr:hypothetical protein [Bacteroidaceae bacterium]
MQCNCLKYNYLIFRTPLETVKGNPYKLADDIWGIGFKTADGIANKMGYEKNDLRRCKSGLVYTLNQLSEDGHVYAVEEQLVESAKKLLEAEEEPIHQALTEMLGSDDLKQEKDAIYLPPFYYSEVGTAKSCLKIFSSLLRRRTIKPFRSRALSAGIYSIISNDEHSK